MARKVFVLVLVAFSSVIFSPHIHSKDPQGEENFKTFLKPLWNQNCVKCHGGEKVKGKVNLKELSSFAQFLTKPKLIQEMIEVIDARDMPPESEPPLSEAKRRALIRHLRSAFAQAATTEKAKRNQIRRLNRFQYNNAVKDLFELNKDLFHLTEKLMTRYGDYLTPKIIIGQAKSTPISIPKAVQAKMPDRVEVECLSLTKSGGFQNVQPFPKDLRAAHGYDNQSNQLTLSPLLLDSFIRLSYSIVKSPDFNEKNVGIWNSFFKEPKSDTDLEAEVKKRLGPFLEKAFRGATDELILDRYTAYTVAKIKGGLSFTESMKKVASAALCSPLFLLVHGSEKEKESIDVQLALASNLSFFLWGSGPDQELLQLARKGELSKPQVLEQTIQRMISDPKIERFLDAFPSQWMQLENVLAATPDPGKNRFFSIDKTRPAGIQMVLEPLLLFDAIFIENRSVLEFIAPKFSYRSDFLKTWYSSELKPPPFDEKKYAGEIEDAEKKRASIQERLTKSQQELISFEASIPKQFEEKLKTFDIKKAQAEWEEVQIKLVSGLVEMSPWHYIGPFSARGLRTAHLKDFVGEKSVDLKKTFGNLKWQLRKDLVDGKVHSFPGQNNASYIYRTIKAEHDQQVEASLGSDDSFRLWLNGKLIKERRVTRGVAPDQDKVVLNLKKGENTFLFKIANGGGGHGFYFKAQAVKLPPEIISILKVESQKRSPEQTDKLSKYYYDQAPALADLRVNIKTTKDKLNSSINQLRNELNGVPKRDQILNRHRNDVRNRFDNEIRTKLRGRQFQRVGLTDPRYGGVITNAAMMSMTSGPKRTHPIARGAWIIEVIFNDPPPPPPNDVPPLNEDAGDQNLTIREKFAIHRENPDCAGCHSRLDPLGFAMENFDITGRWRDKYENGRDVDSAGTLLKKYPYQNVVQFKEFLLKEDKRFAKAFTAHLMRFALGRELLPKDTLVIEKIVEKTAKDGFKLKALIKEVILSESFKG